MPCLRIPRDQLHIRELLAPRDIRASLVRSHSVQSARSTQAERSPSFQRGAIIIELVVSYQTIHGDILRFRDGLTGIRRSNGILDTRAGRFRCRRGRPVVRSMQTHLRKAMFHTQ